MATVPRLPKPAGGSPWAGMRILIANWRELGHPRAGGAEVYTEEVARRLVERGHDVTLFSGSYEGAEEDEVVGGVRRVRRGGTLSVYREGRRFATAHRSDFDVMVDQVNTVPFRLDRVAGGTPVGYLTHQLCREIWFTDMAWPAAVVGRYLAEPWWLSQMRKRPAATVSPSSEAELRRAGFVDLVNLGEGMDGEEIYAARKARGARPKEGRPTVLYLGRHASNKRPLHIIEAGEQILIDVEGSQLWFAGGGPELKAVQAGADRLNRIYGEGRVTVFGRVSEDKKYELMERAWCLAVPSVREGWALVVDEAAAVGTKSVGYPVPGLVDSIPAAGGRLAEEANPVSLSAAVTAELGELRGRAGRVVQGWDGGAESWGAVTDRLEAWLESLIDEPKVVPARSLGF